MKVFLLGGCLALSAAAACAQNAPVPLPCDTKSVQAADAYRVVSQNRLYIHCDNTNIAKLDTNANLFVVAGAARTPVPAVLATVQRVPGGSWLQVDFQNGPNGLALAENKDYQIDLAYDQNATVEVQTAVVDPQTGQKVRKPLPMAGPFAPLTVSFSTKPVASITGDLVATTGSVFQVHSNVALAPFSPGQLKFVEFTPLRVKRYHDMKPELVGPTVPCHLPTPCAPPPPPPGGDPGAFGRVKISLDTDELRQAKATLAVEGLVDLFGQSLKAQSDVTLGAVPKTKDDSLYYLKFDHQAGRGSKPGYAIEAKLAPDLGPPMWSGFVWQPALNMDIGAGTVTGVNVNDTIIPSLGVTSFKTLDRTDLQAVRITPAISFETNKEFNKKNLLYDQDFQFIFGFLNSSRLVRAWKNYNDFHSKPENKDVKFSNDFANWGGGLNVFLGSEIGGALESVTVKASKSTDSVLVPTYSIARLRPKLSGNVEYKRINLTLSFLPRYLFETEFATRQSADGKTIRLVPESGFKPYGEASLSIGLDESGHVSFTSTYKLGAQPPTFQSTNVVQTGILLKY
jgi:hypothetical protein